MSFKIKKSVDVSRVDAFLKSTIETSVEDMEFQVTILSVLIDSENSAMVTYSTSANGKSTNDTMRFTYDTSSNPLTQAEEILKKSLGGY
jgi:hypothetical protein